MLCVRSKVLVVLVSLVCLLLPLVAASQERIDDPSFPNEWGSCSAIVATIGGKQGRFGIAADYAGYCLAGEFAASLPATTHKGNSNRVCNVKVGSADLGAIEFEVLPEGQAHNIDGMLGRDVFQKLVVGYDLNTGYVYCWPKGSNRSEALKWVTSAPTLPSAEHVAISVPIKIDARHRLMLPIASGNGGLFAMLSSYQHPSLIHKQAVGLTWDRIAATDLYCATVDTPVAGEKGVLMPLDLGHGVKFPLLGGGIDFVKDARSEPLVKAGGVVVLTLFDLPTRRLVIDAQHSVMYMEKLSVDGLCSRLATRLFGWPLAVKDGSLVVDTSYAPLKTIAHEKGFAGAKVVRLGDLDGAKVLAMLRSFGHESVRILGPYIGNDLMPDLVLEKDGKRIPVCDRPD